MTTKRIFAATAALILLIASSIVPAMAQMYEKITLVNSTGYTISEVYIAPAASSKALVTV